MAEAGGLSPVRGRERIPALDVLRGVAILGILVVNVELFRGPEFFLAFAGLGDITGPDAVLSFLISAFAEGKFITSLAFLFGLGFTLQGIRAGERGRSPNRLLARRMAVLALFGTVHAIFVWSGDILLTYALIGFVFLLFYRRCPRTLLVWAALAIALPFALTLLLAALTLLTLAVGGGGPEAAEAQAAQLEFFQNFAAASEAAYTSGSYPEMVAQRLRELAFLLPIGAFLYGPTVLAMMLLGASVARSGWTADLAAHRRGIRRAAIVGLGAGLPLNLLYALTTWVDSPDGSVAVLGLPVFILGAPVLAVGYMAAVALLVERFAGASLWRPLSAVGRLALTNYLMQSVIMTAIFYGLALYGSASLAAALLVAAAVIAFQLIYSPIYLRRFSYGPMEWLWRRTTYGRASGTKG